MRQGRREAEGDREREREGERGRERESLGSKSERQGG